MSARLPSRIRLVDPLEPEETRPPDPYETLIPVGKYVVALVREERCVQFRRPTWETTWQIVESGEHFGKHLYCWWRIPDPGERIRPGLALAAAFSIATGLRPPRNLASRKPSWFAGDCQFRAMVRTVGKDAHGVKRPETANYSRVDFLIERVVGTPPCLREKSR